MGRSWFAVGAAVGLGCGLLLGLFAAPEVLGPEESDAPPQAPHESAAAPGAPAPDATPAERRAGDRSRRAEFDPLTLLDVGALPAAPTGTAVLTGRVFDEAGRGLEGVTVAATLAQDVPAAAERETDDPDEILRRQVRDLVRRHRWERLTRREAKTGADGAYRIEGLPAETHQVHAWADGWRFEMLGDRHQVTPPAVVDHLARRRTALRVLVTMPDGSAASEASIQWTDEEGVLEEQGGNWGMAWTPAEDELEIGPGTWYLRASSGRDGEFASEVVEAVVAASGPRAEVSLALAERPGVVVDLGEAGSDGPLSVRVRVAPAGPAPSRRRGRHFPFQGDENERWVEPGQRAAFVPLQPGRHVLLVTLRGGREVHREELDVASGVVRRRIELAGRGFRDWVPVRVVGPDGGPVAGDVSFEAGFRTKAGSTHGDVPCTRAPDGRWRVARHEPGVGGSWGRTGDPDAAAPDVVHWIEAESPRLGRARAEYDPDSADEVVVRFAPTATLDVTVEGADALDADLQVELHPEDSQDAQSREVRKGRVRFETVPVGEVRLALAVAADHWHRTNVAETTLRVAAGENAAVLRVPSLQSLQVTCDEADVLDQVHLSQVRSDGHRLTLPLRDVQNGARTWDLLPPGRYVLTHPEQGEMALTLPGATRVQFAPRPYTALRFSVEDESPAHAAGLRDGDLGVAIDGVEFTSPRQMQALLAAAQLKPRSRLAVLRRGQRVEIDFDFPALGDHASWDYAAR